MTQEPSRPPSRPQRSHQRAYVEAASSELTRDINHDIILERIRALQPIARVDLARASGLQPSTVSSIVEQLLEERWIREGAVVKTARGRRPTMLSLNDDLAMLVADVRPSQAVVAVVDVNGHFLARSVVALSRDAKQSVQNMASAMQRLRGEHAGKIFQGIGVSLPGRVDPGNNRMVIAPNLKWRDFDLAAELSQQMGLRVELENAANSCMLSELWFGRLDRVRNAVLLTVADGVAAAVLAEGRLLVGTNGLAGEFGHIVVEPGGLPCACGQKGCWETVASSRALLRYYAELEPQAGNTSIAELAGLATDGDAAAQEAIARQASAIGRGLRIVNAVLAPEAVLFVGDVSAYWEMAKETIHQTSAGGLQTGLQPRLVLIGDGEMARLRGAAAVVLQRHSGYYRAAHSDNRHQPLLDQGAHPGTDELAQPATA